MSNGGLSKAESIHQVAIFGSSHTKENTPLYKEAYEVGKKLASKAAKFKIKTVVFDRGGFLYHGRVAEVARGAREGGLKF
mgnify:CR=1 FL=1